MSDSENVNGVKVGDVVTWSKVPNGALVREIVVTSGRAWVRIDNDNGIRVADPWGRWGHKHRIALRWRILAPVYRMTANPMQEKVTVVALDLTGQETAADLQRLAEVHEVREFLDRATSNDECTGLWVGSDEELSITINLPNWQHITIVQLDGEEWHEFDEVLQAAAERLHAAGWRPGMTAEDAARLLSEVNDLDIKEDKPHRDIGTGLAVRAVKVSK